MKVFSDDSRAGVWLQAVEYLLNDATNNEEYNLIIEVKEPEDSTKSSKKIEKEFDELLINANLYPLNTVAETIFPATEYIKFGKSGVFDIYPDQIYPKLCRQPNNNKGTYAQRLVRGYGPKGKLCNPLEQCMERLEKQLKKGNGIRVAYELSLDDVESIPINRNDNTVMGFPCLSHISFKLSPERELLHLTALYRSHNYVEKTLGNLLGLARLQSFVARELGIATGSLVCHSTLARLDFHKGLGKQNIEKFLKSTRGNTNGSK